MRRRAWPRAKNEEHWPGRTYLQVTASAGTSGKRIWNRWGVSSPSSPLSWEGRWWWPAKAISTHCLRCSNSSPRARLSFSPRLIKHIGFSGMPHLALGGLEAPPPSGARDRELPLPAFFRRLPCRCKASHSLIQTAASPAPSSLSHPRECLTKRERDPQVHGKPCVFPGETLASDQEEAKAVDVPACPSAFS